jgi:DNA-binding response OmpR family regulator
MQTEKTIVHPLKLLVIEDEGEMCLLVELLLAKPEVTVDYVRTIGAAKDFLEKHQPEVILLDNRLPDGYGIDFIQYVKTTYPGIRIILISGIDLEAEDAALEIGADTFLAKPFNKRQLEESIQKILN